MCLFAAGCGKPAGPPQPELFYLAINESPAEGETARSLYIDLEFLQNTQVYAEIAGATPEAPPQQTLQISADGQVTHNDQAIAQLTGAAVIAISRTGTRLLIDEQVLDIDLADWTLAWVRPVKALPSPVTIVHPEIKVADSFMRSELLTDTQWRVARGDWHLNQHGGGLPDAEADLSDYNVRRAVNPFTVIGSGNGRLEYGTTEWLNYGAEARFFFGVPRQGDVTVTNSMPTSDFRIVHGFEGGPQAAFGWHTQLQAFALLYRDFGEDWRALATFADKRPALTNWVRVGLELADGVRAVGMLDGVEVAAVNLPQRVMGPLAVECAADRIEFDDVAAWTLPRPASFGAPVYVKSRNFAAKDEKDNSDPEQFGQWAKGDGTFVRLRHDGPAAIASRAPLFGDFTYESVPFDADEGDLPTGDYRLIFYSKPAAERMRASQLVEQAGVAFTRVAEGWTSTDPAVTAAVPEFSEFTLQLRRLAAADNCVELKSGDKWVKVSGPLPGPLHVGVSRSSADEPANIPYYRRTTPSPAHHRFASANLVQELFEKAPTDWSWIDGKYRMASRWACQSEWNFMACGSTATPWITSRRSFHGNQEHEYYLSLRPMFAHEGGDYTQEAYDPQKDEYNNWTIFRQNGGWYNRHDLNFSFCSDGKNPMSGYSLVFDDWHRGMTLLLKNGKVVDKSWYGIGSDRVHWKWWNFNVRFYDGRVLIDLNDQRIFDWKDDEPLSGGHAGFWTVRNGFTMSRITSRADTIKRNDQVLYVDNTSTDTAAQSVWKPRLADSVKVTAQSGSLNTRVTSTVGGGHFAVRHQPKTPVNLAETPILELPVRLGKGASVNLHLYVSGESFMVQVGDSEYENCKALLTPEYESGEMFRISRIPDSQLRHRLVLASVDGDGVMRLDLPKLINAARPWGKRDDWQLSHLTVGNSSNTDYLLAGNTANKAGAWYDIGTPVFKKSSE
jgi:hypothetical protein